MHYRKCNLCDKVSTIQDEHRVLFGCRALLYARMQFSRLFDCSTVQQMNDCMTD
jgi:hypothetical protein